VEKKEFKSVNFRKWVKSTPAGALAWRLAVGFIGGIITFFGLLFLITPGPGIPVLLIGLGVLASEFAWASSAVQKAKAAANSANERAPFLKLKIVIPVALVISVFLALFLIYNATR
jgi:hypothetical protein